MSYKRKQIGKEKDMVVFPIAESLNNMPENYQKFIEKIKGNIKQERIKAHISANKTMILMYWNIGNSILEQQNNEGWGTKVIDRMSHDLKNAFPDMTRFSPRNLKYMRKFADAWQDIEIVQRTVAQIPWRSNITLLDKLTVEYSLSGFNNPIGVSNWENEIVKSIPENIKSSLPSIEEIEKELGNE